MVILILLAVVAVVSAMILLGRFVTIASASRRRRHDWASFRAMAQEKGLDRAQTNLARQMVRAARITRPYMLLASPRWFDRGVEALMRDLQDTESYANRQQIDQQLGLLRRKLHFLAGYRDMPLATTRGIQPNQRVRLSAKTDSGERHIHAVVWDVTETEILLSWASDEPGRGQMTIGEDLTVYFWRENDAGYTFHSRATRIFSSPVSGIALEHARRLERIQRRNFVRAPVTTPVAFTRVGRSPNAPLVSEPVYTLAGATVDISGGGLSMKTDAFVNIGDFLALRLALDSQTSLDALPAKVVREEGGPLSGRTVHVEFVGITEKTREEIIRFVYKLASQRLS